LAQWDPYSLPIISEYEGTVKLQDVIDGITMHEEKNRITGLIERVIIEHRAEQLQPQVLINEAGKRKAGYPLPVDTNMVVHDGDKVQPGMCWPRFLRKFPRAKTSPGVFPAWRNSLKRANRVPPR
jgi:DNA-directed RNA polymerase subunit beta'